MASLTALFACACGGASEEEDPGTLEGNATAAARTLATGDYELASERVSGHLTVASANAKEVRFSVTLVNRFGGNNEGQLDEVIARPADGGWVYENRAADCRFELKAVADGIEAKQSGNCGFGNQVIGTGKYKKAQHSADRSVPQTGTYKINDTIKGALVIKSASASEIGFSLAITQSSPPHNMGELENVKAQRTGDVWIHDDRRSDCHLELKVDGGSIRVKQQGICGFGNNVDAEGTYIR